MLLQFSEINFRIVFLLESKFSLCGEEGDHPALPVLEAHSFPSVPNHPADRLGIAADPSGAGIGETLYCGLDTIFILKARLHHIKLKIPNHRQNRLATNAVW